MNEEEEALIQAIEQFSWSDAQALAEERALDPSEADRRRREVLQAPLPEALICPIRSFPVEPMCYRPTLWEHILE